MVTCRAPVKRIVFIYPGKGKCAIPFEEKKK